jgi:putative redox protein
VTGTVTRVTTAMVRAVGRLAPGSGRSVDLDIDGFEVRCEVPADDRAAMSGVTSIGLLAASLSACTAMSSRTFLQRWHIEPSRVQVEVRMHGGRDAVMERHVVVDAALAPDMREQLAAVVDETPVTVLLRDSVTIVTRISSGPAASGH